ncbi:hypothetical protein CHS0354_023785 [Potamilus streckersoni]|uniref:ACT domain-containing protein n=1 Tax=Potamilus streckersoni TaxID=2493646 RepID=A0AAE0RYU5_9BIVA|nr:hypothetical protein CHS0354_023785 [Potamilus streckersoni]
MKILKFGGTSVGTVENIKNVINIIKNDDTIVGVVVSAFSKITDKLLHAAMLASSGSDTYKKIFEDISRQHNDFLSSLISNSDKALLQNLLKELSEILHGVYLIKELSPKMKALICSFGERMSAIIITAACINQKINTEYLDARLLIKTDASFNEANVLFSETNRAIKDFFQTKKRPVQIITGFIGSTNQNETTTLGRGGSDYTASIFGASLELDAIEIWTDVDGFMTADPKIVTDSISIAELSYEEAVEIAHYGAKILYPPTISPAMKQNIPIIIKNTLNPTFSGTKISKKSEVKAKKQVASIAALSDCSLIRIHTAGFASSSSLTERVYSVMSRSKIKIPIFTPSSSEAAVISFAIFTNDIAVAKDVLEREFEIERQLKKIGDIEVQHNVAIMAIVGDNMQHTPGIAGRFFTALGQNGINVVAINQGSSERSISIVINNSDKIKALNVTHQAFFLSNLKTINLFLVGTGLIGKTLLKQLHNHCKILESKHGIKLQLVGLANSRKMYFSSENLNFENALNILDSKGESMSMLKYMSQIIDMNLLNSVFIDCTASDEVSNNYIHILSESISIVTPNKRACSREYSYYKKLKEIESSRGVKFLYETNVGAGLPIIRTLSDLIASGDKIIKIEAVLSGSLSFIFNAFDQNTPFSQIVKIAKEKGYTEPDPRDDLSGKDVARKILILARETGANLELHDVNIESFLPSSCIQAKSVQEFFIELQKFDGEFEELRKKAELNHQKLRFIASFENQEASVRLQNISSNHPFANLNGSDNIIAFTTDRYSERQLIVQGPGAGKYGSRISSSFEKNTAGVAAIAFLKSLNQTQKGINISIEKNMPLQSGLGSSGASAVACAVALNRLFGTPYSRKELLPFVMQAEEVACGAAHADNVAPSLLGGITLIRSNETLDIVSLPVPKKIFVAVVHPHLEINTKDARAILPKEIPMQKFVQQTGNIAGFIASLYTQDFELMKRSLNDEIIEPVRSKLVPHFDLIKEVALANRALGFSLSGSGPSVFGFAQSYGDAENIAFALQLIWHQRNIATDSFISTINEQGATVIS